MAATEKAQQELELIERQVAEMESDGADDATLQRIAELQDRIEILRRYHVPIGTTHHIDPDLDAERTLIVTALRRAGLVRAMVMEPGIGRTTNGRNASGDRFFTDGQVAVMILRQ